MKTWQTIDVERLTAYKQEIDSVRKESTEAQCDKVGEYYQYLAENKHVYGNLAYLAATNTEIEGRYANNYLASVAKKSGVEITEELRQKIMCDLAVADIEARGKAHGEVISGDAIRKYHGKVLGTHGLSSEAWTGSFFEHIGPGAFMLGQGPEDQNGGNFTVKNVNAFLKKATVTGSKEHLALANFTGEALDWVLSKTLSESSVSEIVQFYQRGSQGLQGNLFGLANKYSAQAAAQTRTRSNYRQVFAAKAREAVEPPPAIIPSPQDIQRKLVQMTVDPMAIDKEMYDTLKRSSAYLAAKAAIEGKALQKIFSDMQPSREAEIEYQRIYGEPMPDTLKQTLSAASAAPLAQDTVQDSHSAPVAVPFSTSDQPSTLSATFFEQFEKSVEHPPRFEGHSSKTGTDFSRQVDDMISAHSGFKVGLINPSILNSEIKHSFAKAAQTLKQEISAHKATIASPAAESTILPASIPTSINIETQRDIHEPSDKPPASASVADVEGSRDTFTGTSTEAPGFFSRLFSFFSGPESHTGAPENKKYTSEAAEDRGQSTPIAHRYNSSSYANHSAGFFASTAAASGFASSGFTFASAAAEPAFVSAATYESASSASNNSGGDAGNSNSASSFGEIFNATLEGGLSWGNL